MANATTLRNYQKSVMRDLSWLFNAKACLDEEVIAEFPQIGSSVLNFGARDFCGVTASSLDRSEIEQQLTEAIQRFEPRIIPSTLSVRAVDAPEKAIVHLLTFEITAEIWATPFPEKVFIKTELDLETGQYALR